MNWWERNKVRVYGGWGALGAMLALLWGLLALLAPSVLQQARIDTFGTRGKLRMATAAPDGAYQRLGKLLAEATRRDGLKLQLQTTEGSLENLELLEKGDVDLALVQGALPVTEPGVLALARLKEQLVHVVVPVDSPIRTIADLAGKRVAVGGKRSGFTVVAERLQQFYNFAPAPTFAHVPVAAMSQALEDGSVDAVLAVYALFAPAMEKLLASGRHRLVPLSHTGALERYAPGMVAGHIPDGCYGPQRSLPVAPVETMAMGTLLVGSQHVGDGQVWAILRAVYGTEFITRGKLAGFDESHGRAIREVPLHPAARDYYARNAPISSDRFEIASFFIAALLAVASCARDGIVNADSTGT